MEPSSPTRVGNFVISYQNSADYDLIEGVNTEDLLKFIQTSPNHGLSDGTDSAFFPRVFTDVDLIQLGDNNSEYVKPENQRSTSYRADTLNGIEVKDSCRRDDSLQVCREINENSDMNSDESFVMEGRQSDGFTVSFQPDVIACNSNQRSGPDGSPALVPSATSHGFHQTVTMNDTGELFAPVRTLTFSDVDQSSHIGDTSFMNHSRFVSTPDRVNVQHRGVDESSPAALSEGEVVAQQEVSDSDSENDVVVGHEGEFRQLVGEVDNDLANTGAFDPSAMGLNKEFMDSFTGRSGGVQMDGNIFSPLGNTGYGMEDRQSQSRTPPIHVPGPDSPFFNRFGHKSPQTGYNPAGKQSELAASPSRNPPDFLLNERFLGTQDTSSLPVQNNPAFIGSRQDYVNDQLYNQGYPNGSAFQPIEKQAQKFVPKNLNEYFELQNESNNAQSWNNQKHVDISDSKQNQHECTSQPNRQADGFESDTTEQVQTDSSFDRLPEMSQSMFEQRYLQKTQVSVKLPQATYDTMSAEEFSHEEKSLGDQILMSGCEQTYNTQLGSIGDSEGMQTLKQGSKATPEKVVDLLQTQVSNLKDEAKSLENPRVNIEKNEDQNETTKKTNFTAGKYGKVNDVNLNSNSLKRNDNSIGDSKLTANSRGENPKVQSQPSKISGSQSHPAAAKATVQQNQTQHAPVAPYQPSARLLQETVSQKNKTCQKYISNNPGMPKSAANQSKDFKKPHEVSQKALGMASGAGSRKQVPAETEKAAKGKVSDKPKCKSFSNESLHQKSKAATSMPVRTDLCDKSGSSASTHHHLAMNQNQGYITRGQRSNGHNHSSHSVEESGEPGRVITQVETTSPVPVEPLEGSRCTARLGSHPGPSDRSVRPPVAGETSLDVKGMEDVRRQLQGMLRFSHETMAQQDRSQYEHSEIVAGYAVDFPDPNRPADMSWDYLRKAHDSDMPDPFTSFSSQLMTDSGNVSRSDVSLHAENQRLRDMLEKERYRRKHCEQYIQQLNVKLLEAQQQVAVAVSMDKRKDVMIEQLDKQLAKVVEGWKTRDLEKDLLVAEAQKEKEKIQQDMSHQQEVIGQFERNMSEALGALQKEKETSAQTVQELKDQVIEVERAKSHAEELLSGEREKSDLLQQECDNLREGRDTLDKKLDQMQRRLHREQDEWFQREQELLQRIEEVSEQNTKILQIEREKNEEQGKLAEEIMDQYQASTNKVKKLEMELDAVLREKESVKVEMGIMEAKFENTQRSLEASLQTEMKKQIAEHVTEMQQKSEKLQDEMRERHHQQVLELNQRHARETENQLATFREELHNREEDFRKQLQELETRLLEYRTENTELKMSKQKLESSRLEILTKLQYTMQTQWNEALSLLATSPRKNPSQTSAEDHLSASSQSIPTLNFNLHTSHKPANQNSPNRSAISQSHLQEQPDNMPTNQSSSPRFTASQNDPSLYTGGPGGVASQLGERHNEASQKADMGVKENIGDGNQEEVAIETAAMSHLKDFQDYMNSLTQTPEWISSINTQQQQQHPDSASSNQRPSPVDFTALLASHLQSVEQAKMMPLTDTSVSQSNASRKVMPFPDMSVSQSNVPISQQLHSLPTNQRSFNQTQFSSLPVDSATLYSNVSASQGSSSFSKPNVLSQEGNYSVHSANFAQGHSPSGSNSSVLWDRAPEMSRAVPIRPPQQGEDPYIHDEDHSIISSVAGSQVGYFQGGQSFSPPTKQNRVADDDSMDDLGQQSSRLTEDYSDLSHRLAEHETHQNELQHYIQMLLHRSPSDAGYHNDTMCSQDQDTVDLNDTAQAAQLERELDRLQELRRKQEASSKNRGTGRSESASGPPTDSAQQGPEFRHIQEPSSKNLDTADRSSVEAGGNKILDPDQLAEIAKLLNQVKGGARTGDPQIAQLLDVLKHATPNQPPARKGAKGSPRAAVPGVGDKHKGLAVHGASQGDKQKGLSVGKKSAQYQPSKGFEGPKQAVDCSKSDKQGSKPTPAKKMERKVAGAAAKGDKGSKPAAWK